MDAFPNLGMVVTLPERKMLADASADGGRRRRRSRDT